MTNPYTPGTGGTLAGIGELLKGLFQLNDPAAQQRDRLAQLIQSNPNLRDQYIQQYGDNPEALDQLLGTKPLVGKKKYNETRSLFSGPLSPEAQARNAKAKADIASAANSETISRTLQPILQQGAKVDAFINRGEGGVSQPAPQSQPGDAAQGIESIPVVKGPGMSDDEYQTYREALTGKIQTPQERELAQANLKYSKSQLAHQEVLTENAKLGQPLTKLKTTKETEAIKQADEDKRVAQAAMARLGNQNLYEAKLKGKISNSEQQAIFGYEKGKDQYKNDQDAYFTNERLKIEQQNADRMGKEAKLKKDEIGALHIFTRASDLGVPISMDDARSITADPQSILNSTDPKDEPVKVALKEIRGANLKETRNKINATIVKWNSALKGKQPSDDDVKMLNDEIFPLFGGTLFEPIVYQRTDTYDPRSLSHPITGKEHVGIQPISGDPEILKSMPVGFNQVPKKATQTQTTQSSPADRYESLKKKYPKENVEQLKVRVLKGES